MTKRIEKQTIINCTPYQIYNFVSVLQNWPQITKITSVTKTPDELTYTLTLNTLLSKKSFTITVTKTEPPTTFAYKNNSLIFTNESGFEITEHPEGSCIKVYTQVEAGPIANTLALHGITKKTEKELEEMLTKLKLVLGKIDPPKDNLPDPKIVSDLEEINSLLKKSQDRKAE